MRLALPLIFAIATLIGAPMLITRWDRIERENNAFAKDCNDRGGVATFEPSARQCTGARSKEQPHVG